MLKGNKKFLSYRMKVSLLGNRRGYNRTFLISGERTLDELSEFILDSFDFDNDHLYVFTLDKDYFSEKNSYHLDYEYFKRKSTDISIKNLNLTEKQRIRYLFDWGDRWEFEIFVQKIEYKDDDFEAKVLKSVGELEQYPDYDF